MTLQGDHSACAKPPVDFKTKVPLWPGVALIPAVYLEVNLSPAKGFLIHKIRQIQNIYEGSLCDLLCFIQQFIFINVAKLHGIFGSLFKHEFCQL